MAGQIWCDISPGIPRSSVWRHLQPFRYRWSAPRTQCWGRSDQLETSTIDRTDKLRSSSCQEVQLSHSIGRDNGASTIRTCRRRPRSGRAGTAGRRQPPPRQPPPPRPAQPAHGWPGSGRSTAGCLRQPGMGSAVPPRSCLPRCRWLTGSSCLGQPPAAWSPLVAQAVTSRVQTSSSVICPKSW